MDTDKGVSYLDPEDLADEDHRQVLSYWSALCGGAFAPGWKDWDWMQLPAALIPYFVVTDVLHDPLDFRYRFYGTAHVDIYGHDYTNHLISEIMPTYIAVASHEQYQKVLDQRKPVVTKHTVEIAGKYVARDQISVRMPLSSDGAGIDMIISFADYRKAKQDMIDATHQAGGDAADPK